MRTFNLQHTAFPIPVILTNMGNAHPTTAPTKRSRFDGHVEINRLVCKEHYLLRIRLPESFPSTNPGQFIQISCTSSNPNAITGSEIELAPGKPPKFTQSEITQQSTLLRRPFSLAGRGDDQSGPWIEIVYRVVGTGTAYLANLKPNDPVDLIGPLGNTFTIPKNKSLGLLVGGGVGLPPMFYTAQALKQAGYNAVAFVGAMSKDLLAVTHSDKTPHDTSGLPALSVNEFAQHDIPSVVTTDDGSAGMTGRITDGLQKYIDSLTPQQIAQAIIYTCGPNPMLKAVANIGDQHNIETQLCMEQAMACGMGTCQSCIVRIEDHQNPQGKTADGTPWRFRLTCTDGPVFNSKIVVWNS